MAEVASEWVFPALPEHACANVVLSARAEGGRTEWLGSTIHGALGHALMEVAPQGQREHLYREVFEAPPETSDDGRLQGARPTPLILQPPPPTRTERWVHGEEWRLGVVLFGAAALRAELVLSAIERMAEQGLGPERVPFRVESLAMDRRTATEVEAWPGATLTLRCKTPLALQRDKRLLVAPRFADVVLDSQRRLAALASLYGSTAPAPWSQEALWQASDAITTTSISLERVRFERYSARQEHRHWMEGLLGEVTFTGPALAHLGGLLASSAAVGIGKATAFGFGQFEVE